ncbi:hypothetical protein M595_2661 [Lyngbya aestuarii BL J]|uniref:Uncharacterized protein n=1 Tax=Lyngbya aestuarii BL J TaxID=1348334 RepID=U7QLX0_9CYAN|nr:hypothetical protein M595_2661 [Lyngbya aestuarii BL J]
MTILTDSRLLENLKNSVTFAKPVFIPYSFLDYPTRLSNSMFRKVLSVVRSLVKSKPLYC